MWPRRKEPLMFPLLGAAALAAGLITSSDGAATIEAGRPARVRVNARVAIVDGRTVAATLLDPIYTRERVVVSAGASVSGRIERMPIGSRARVAAGAGGDLTPPAAARVRFDTLTTAAGTSARIAAVAAVDVDEPAAAFGEWVKDYALSQLPYHRRYLHAKAVLTMTFVEPATLAPEAEEAHAGDRVVAARLITPIDTVSARPGDRVLAALLEPMRGADGSAIAIEGTVVTGIVAAASRARAFGRGGRVAIRFDTFTSTGARSGTAVRFVWPPLAALALIGARDPSARDASTFFGRGGAGWSGFLAIGAAVAQISQPVALGFGAWGLAHSTWTNVVRRGRDVVLPANSIVLLSTGS